MRLRELKVRCFRCVRNAHVVFEPGLNVLHGPNDLGKTTLFEAVRAALLLPHTSSHVESLVPWHDKETPEVTLVFETEAQRIYRVRKVFGPGGRSLLELSRDGVSFGAEAQGRSVDEKLRTLLQWGIPSPGGRGGVKGLPESFLSRVLLAGPDVAEVLRSSLKADRDDTGRLRITTALEALAEDKLFKAVLQRTMQKVAIAFTAAGRKRGGKGSPWIEVRDRINEASAEHREWERQAQQARAVQKQLDELETECRELERRSAEARSLREQVDAVWAKQLEVEAVREKLGRAEAELLARKEKHEAVRKAEKELAGLRAAVDDCVRQEQQARTKLDEAVANRDQARARLDQVMSDDSAKEREIARGRLEKSKIELQVREDAALRRRELADRARDAEKQATEAEARVKQLEASVAALEAKIEGGKKARAEAALRLELLQAAETLRDHDAVRSQLEEAEQSAAAAERGRRDAQARRAEAEELRKRVNATEVPSPATLEAMQALSRDLAVAEATVAVGLAVQITPSSPLLVVDVSVDDGEASRLNLDAPIDLGADRRIGISLPGVAEISVSAGSEADRRRAGDLRKRWKKEAVPVLARAAVGSLPELEAACREVRGWEEKIREVERGVAELEAKVRLEADRAGRADDLRQRLELLTGPLERHRREDIERASALYKTPQQVRQAIDAARRAVEKSVSEAAAAETEATRERTRLESEREQLARVVALRDEARGKLEGGWKSVLGEVKKELEAVAKERKEAEASLAGLEKRRDSALREAEKAHEAAKVAVESATAASDLGRNAVQGAKEKVSMHEGGLVVLRRAAEASDVPAAELVVGDTKKELARVEGELGSLGASGWLCQKDVESAAEAQKRAESLIRDKQLELASLKGSLDRLGGQIAGERLAEAQEVLEQLQRVQDTMEVEYGGWQLLQEVLTEAQQEEEAHLGQLLSGPIEKRFAALTGGRYGGLSLDSHLETGGVMAAGATRDVEALSTGTLEQLATIFRLCLAEQLGTAVVLDDHLSHTHSERLSWFRDTLSEVSERAQVIVVTCWPEHYVGRKKKGIGVLDLGGVIERY